MSSTPTPESTPDSAPDTKSSEATHFLICLDDPCTFRPDSHKIACGADTVELRYRANDWSLVDCEACLKLGATPEALPPVSTSTPTPDTEELQKPQMCECEHAEHWRNPREHAYFSVPAARCTVMQYPIHFACAYCAAVHHSPEMNKLMGYDRVWWVPMAEPVIKPEPRTAQQILAEAYDFISAGGSNLIKLWNLQIEAQRTDGCGAAVRLLHEHAGEILQVAYGYSNNSPHLYHDDLDTAREASFQLNRKVADADGNFRPASLPIKPEETSAVSCEQCGRVILLETPEDWDGQPRHDLCETCGG